MSKIKLFIIRTVCNVPAWCIYIVQFCDKWCNSSCLPRRSSCHCSKNFVCVFIMYNACDVFACSLSHISVQPSVTNHRLPLVMRLMMASNLSSWKRMLVWLQCLYKLLTVSWYYYHCSRRFHGLCFNYNISTQLPIFADIDEICGHLVYCFFFYSWLERKWHPVKPLNQSTCWLSVKYFRG